MRRITLFAAATGSQVDRESGILRGVSVITEGEAKGHGVIVDSVTLEQVKACAETYTDGLRVKMDHHTGIDAMVGVLRDFAIDGIQLRADLHLLKSHEDFEKILEMAENMPGSFGLSISFSGESEAVKMPYKKGKYEPNSGELPSHDVEIVRAARCMEIYSADLVDQPAANPSGLFQAMSEEIKTEEVPAVAPVEEVKVEEVAPKVTPLVETLPAPEVPTAEVESEEVTEVLVIEESQPGSEEESLVSKEEFEVKGKEGTQNLPEDKKPEVKAEAPVISDEEAGKVIKAKLSAVVESFDLQKGEIISLQADLETARRNLSALTKEVALRDERIASLEETKRIALLAAGLLPSDAVIELSANSEPFNPVAAYHSAIEAGDKKAAAELFKAHKAAIFAARRN